jgi:hypothetical protein
MARLINGRTSNHLRVKVEKPPVARPSPGPSPVPVPAKTDSDFTGEGEQREG